MNRNEFKEFCVGMTGKRQSFAEATCHFCAKPLPMGPAHVMYYTGRGSTAHVCPDCDAIIQDYIDGMVDAAEPLECTECHGDIFTGARHIVDANGNTACLACRDSYFKCRECGEFHHVDEKAGEYGGDGLCESCYDESFATCEKCGEIIRLDDAHFFNETMYCDGCYEDNVATCRSCGNELSRVDNYHIDGHDYCEDCYCNNFTTCDDCGDTIASDDAYCDEDGGCYCDACWEGHGVIREYSFKPRWEFHRTARDSRNPLFLGVELEVENKAGAVDNDIAAQRMLDTLPCVCKHDSSINDGFEIVMHPMTFAYAKEAEKTVDSALDYLRKKGFAGHNYGGMHVHMGKAAFSNLHVLKFVRLFSDNVRFWTTISQRRKENLDRWAGFADSPDDIIFEQAKWCKDYTNANRYTALNFTGKTIEVRIFNSSIRTDRFFKNLEACQAAFAFSRDYGLCDMTAAKFCAYIISRRSEFPNLAAFLAEHNMGTGANMRVFKQLKGRAERLRKAVGSEG